MKQHHNPTPLTVVDHAFLNRIETVNTGGHIFVDLITLNDGQVIGISDDCICLYPNEQEFYDCHRDADIQRIDFKIGEN